MLLAPGEAPQLVRPLHLQMSGWRGPRCSPAPLLRPPEGAPGLASPQPCRDGGVSQALPTPPGHLPHAHMLSSLSHPKEMSPPQFSPGHQRGNKSQPRRVSRSGMAGARLGTTPGWTNAAAAWLVGESRVGKEEDGGGRGGSHPIALEAINGAPLCTGFKRGWGEEARGRSCESLCTRRRRGALGRGQLRLVLTGYPSRRRMQACLVEFAAGDTLG